MWTWLSQDHISQGKPHQQAPQALPDAVQIFVLFAWRCITAYLGIYQNVSEFEDSEYNLCKMKREFMTLGILLLSGILAVQS